MVRIALAAFVLGMLVIHANSQGQPSTAPKTIEQRLQARLGELSLSVEFLSANVEAMTEQLKQRDGRIVDLEKQVKALTPAKPDVPAGAAPK